MNFIIYRARQKNGSQVARILQARPGRSGKQQQEQNTRNLGTVFFAGPCTFRSLGLCESLDRRRDGGPQESHNLLGATPS